MLTHRSIWDAIDTLAEQKNLSVSGLARRAGLDPTTFNKSKRLGRDGRERWPSTESLAKILDATGESIDRFVDLVGTVTEQPCQPVPLLAFDAAASDSHFDEAGHPCGAGWDAIPFPDPGPDDVYALEVSGDSMMPLYRDGDIIIVAPGEPFRRGDRVVLKTMAGEVLVRTLKRRTARTVEVSSLDGRHDDDAYPTDDVRWISRIVWASQ